MTRRQIVVVSAGLRAPSSTRMLADRLAQASIEALGERDEQAVTEVVEVREHAHAIMDALLTGFPTGELADDLKKVTSADALVLVTPTFQASYSGLFKSFMDLIEQDALRYKPVILAATGGTERHSLVLEHSLRPMMAYLRALPMPTAVYAATSDFGEGSQGLEARIRRSASELASYLSSEQEAQAPEQVTHLSDEAEDGVVPFAQLLSRFGVSG